eukprot:g443.t1
MSDVTGQSDPLDPLLSSLITLSQRANELPGNSSVENGDFDFYSTFPAFSESSVNQGQRIRSLIKEIVPSNIPVGLSSTPTSEIDNDDETFRSISTTVDSLLESVDMSLDEVRGMTKSLNTIMNTRNQAPAAAARQQERSKTNASTNQVAINNTKRQSTITSSKQSAKNQTKYGAAPGLILRASMPKPEFSAPIDNSRETTFQPLLKSKPNASVQSLEQWEEEGVQHTIHHKPNESPKKKSLNIRVPSHITKYLSQEVGTQAANKLTVFSPRVPSNPYAPELQKFITSIKSMEAASTSQMTKQNKHSADNAHFLWSWMLQAKMPSYTISKPTDLTLQSFSNKFEWIDTLEQLENLCTDLVDPFCQVFAIDLEHHSYRSFQGLTCLMQISYFRKRPSQSLNHPDDNGNDSELVNVLIDTIALREYLHLLNSPFTDPEKCKVMHGASYDILWLQRDFGLYIVNLFDTGIASKVLQLRRNSLAYLLEYYVGFKANKAYQLADWRVRPLTPEMTYYAVCDTYWLLYIYARMKTDLLEMGQKAKYSKRFLEQVIVTSNSDVANQYDESTGYILPNLGLFKFVQRMTPFIQKYQIIVQRRGNEMQMTTVFDELWSEIKLFLAHQPTCCKELIEEERASLQDVLKNLIVQKQDIVMDNRMTESRSSSTAKKETSSHPLVQNNIQDLQSTVAGAETIDEYCYDNGLSLYDSLFTTITKNQYTGPFHDDHREKTAAYHHGESSQMTVSKERQQMKNSIGNSINSETNTDDSITHSNHELSMPSLFASVFGDTPIGGNSFSTSARSDMSSVSMNSSTSSTTSTSTHHMLSSSGATLVDSSIIPNSIEDVYRLSQRRRRESSSNSLGTVAKTANAKVGTIIQNESVSNTSVSSMNTSNASVVNTSVAKTGSTSNRTENMDDVKAFMKDELGWPVPQVTDEKKNRKSGSNVSNYSSPNKNRSKQKDGNSRNNKHVQSTNNPKKKKGSNSGPFMSMNPWINVAWFSAKQKFWSYFANFETKEVTLANGGQLKISIDADSKHLPETAPLCIILPTITGTDKGQWYYVREARKRGYRSIVFSRRGHFDCGSAAKVGETPRLRRLSSPQFNIMGSVNDTSTLISYVKTKLFPKTSFIGMIGISAGSGVLVNYLGTVANRTPVQAAVGVSPAWDISQAFHNLTAKQPFFDSYIASGLKRFFIDPNVEVLKSHNADAYEKCRRASTVQEFIEAASPYANERRAAHDQTYDSSAYFRDHNPINSARNIAVPILMFNAEDDMLCLRENIQAEEFANDLENAALILTKCGSHIAYSEGFFGEGNYFVRKSLDFFDTIKANANNKAFLTS